MTDTKQALTGQQRGRLRDPELQRARAMAMLKMRMRGLNYAEIAQHFDCSVDTVQRAMVWANRNGLAREYEQSILTDLVPEALKVYGRELQKGNVKIAQDVLDKMIRLGERFEKREQVQESQTLGAYLAEKRMALERDKKGLTQHEHEATTQEGFSESYLDDLAGDSPAGAGTTGSSDQAQGRTVVGQDGVFRAPQQWASEPAIDAEVVPDGARVIEVED